MNARHMCSFFLQISPYLFLWNGLGQAVSARIALGHEANYGPNPLAELFLRRFDNNDHKIVTKSVEMSNDKDHTEQDVKSRNTVHYHEGRGDSSSSSRIMLATPLESEQSKASNANGDGEDEEKILQEIIAARRDAMRFKVRNSSELHIDNHKEVDDPTPKPQSYDPIENVVVLPKPFHFHIPIISNISSAKQSTPSQKKVNVRNTVSLKVNTPYLSAKPKRENRATNSDEVQKENTNSDEIPSARKTSDEITAPWNHSHSDRIEKRNAEPLFLNTKIAEIPSSTIDNRFHSLRNPVQSKVSPEDRIKTDLDALIDQHPRLIPPMNRKRNSGHNIERQDVVDDETHHYMMVFKREQHNDDVGVSADEIKMPTFKREVKTLNFSQGVFDSILGHEDDLVKYHNNIQSHAQKLGVEPQEVFHKVVYGNSSNEPQNNITDANSTAREIQRRRHQFQQLFLSDATESGKQQNEILRGKQEDSGNGEKQGGRYSAYMKILRRERRGLKKWLKKLFKKDENYEDRSATTRKTTHPTTQTPKRREYSSDEETEKPKPRVKTYYHQEIDRDGNAPVDLLLPNPLRRSTYLKKKEEIKSRAAEDEEFEEEYEKSEEKEVKTRSQEEEAVSKKEADKRKKSKKKTVHKRSIPGEDHVAPIEENMENPGDQLIKFSKDEVLLVHEMLLNIVNFRCADISRSTLDNILSINQVVIRISKLPEYITERRLKVDRLFDQILSCSSNEENLSRWKSPSKGGETENLFPLSDVPHKRIKRIRRRRNEIEKEVSEEEIKRSFQTFSEMSEAHKGSSGAIIPRLMKLNLLIYKLILETCAEVIDPDLLHEAEIILVQEFIHISKVEEMRREVEFYAKRIDTSLVERSLLECYNKKS